jgi:hypothetical protein
VAGPVHSWRQSADCSGGRRATTDWKGIGQLAAIAVIRTFLNYFLEKDIVETRTIDRAGSRSHTAEVDV